MANPKKSPDSNSKNCLTFLKKLFQGYETWFYAVLAFIIQVIAFTILFSLGVKKVITPYFPPYISDMVADPDLGPTFLFFLYIIILFAMKILLKRLGQMIQHGVYLWLAVLVYIIGLFAFLLNMVLLLFPNNIHEIIHNNLAKIFFVTATVYFMCQTIYYLYVYIKTKTCGSLIFFIIRLILLIGMFAILIVQLVVLIKIQKTTTQEEKNRLTAITTTLEWIHAVLFALSTVAFSWEMFKNGGIEKTDTHRELKKKGFQKLKRISEKVCYLYVILYVLVLIGAYTALYLTY